MVSRLACLLLASTIVFGGPAARADDLLSKDRVGKADAPRVMTLRLTNDGPGSTGSRLGRGLSEAPGRPHPEASRLAHRAAAHVGQHGPGAGAHARADPGASGAGLRGCGFLHAAAFHEGQGAPTARRLLLQGRCRRPVSLRAPGHHGTGRAHLCLVVGNRPARPLPQHRDRAGGALDLGRARGGRLGLESQGHGRPALQRRPVGGHDIRLAGELLVPGRAIGRRGRPAGLRRGREPREVPQGGAVLPAPRGLGRGLRSG